MFLNTLAMLQSMSLGAIGVAVLLCLSTKLVKQMLEFAGFTVYLCVVLWTITLCLWCGTSVYSAWGLLPLLVGVLFGGVGVIPIALLGFLFSGRWLELGELLAFLVPIVAGTVVAPWMLEQSFLYRQRLMGTNGGFRSLPARPMSGRAKFGPVRVAVGSAVLRQPRKNSGSRQ
jgi:hypothetical protein